MNPLPDRDRNNSHSSDNAMCARAQFPTDTLKNTETHITTTIPQYVKVVGHINGHEKDFLSVSRPPPFTEI